MCILGVYYEYIICILYGPIAPKALLLYYFITNYFTIYCLLFYNYRLIMCILCVYYLCIP
jgi:hypothetical protein